MASSPVKPPIKTPAERLAEEDAEWSKLGCSKNIPITIEDLRQWVLQVAECLKVKPSNTDQIGIDPYTNGYNLRGYFGPLQGGKLMNAMGTNNDCLIHSFLTCVCPIFRQYATEIRINIARYFRRFVATQLPDARPQSLNSFNFLETGDLEVLCKYFHVPFIVVSGSLFPVDRSFDIQPYEEDPFWKDREEKTDQPYYVIHGSGSHFTPVSWNQSKGDKYEFIGQSHRQLIEISARIEQEKRDDMDTNLQRILHTNEAIYDFLKGNPEIQQIKQRINAQQTSNGKSSIINTVVLRLAALIREEIDRLEPAIDYRKDHGYQNMMNYISSLSGGANNAQSAQLQQAANTTPKFVPEDMELAAAIEASKKTYEEEQAKKKNSTNTAAQAEADLAEAVLKSLESAKQEGVKTATSEQLNAPSNVQQPIKNAKPALSANDVLRRMSNITATIAGNSTQYDATVYKASNSPLVSNASKGGKRKLRTLRIAKKSQHRHRKTKRHIKK